MQRPLKDFNQELDTIRFIYLEGSPCLQWKNTLEGGYIRHSIRMLPSSPKRGDYDLH